MQISFATDPLACWGTPPGSLSLVGDTCEGLVKLAVARHGAEIVPVVRPAASRDPQAAYELSSGWKDKGLAFDEAKAWLWVAGSLGHPDAANQIAVALQLETLNASQETRDMLRNAIQAWRQCFELAEGDGMTGVKTGIGTLKRSGTIVDGVVEDPENLAPRADEIDLPGHLIAEFGLDEPDAESDLPGLVVLPFIGDLTSREGAELNRRFGKFVKRKLPWKATLPAVGEVRRSILARWPWAADAARDIEAQFAKLRAGRQSAAIRVSPILLVGEPGSGKSSIAQFVLSKLMGLEATVIPCGGVADGGGFSAVTRGWSTARPSVIVSTMLQKEICNPGFVLDELDKTSTPGSQNGSVMATLLNMVQTNSYLDTCLQSPIDISGVSFIATANNARRIDPALLDRFTIIRIPTPRLEDFDVLVTNAREDFITENNLHGALVPYLGEFERAFLLELFASRRSARAVRLAYERVVSWMMAEAEAEPPKVLN